MAHIGSKSRTCPECNVTKGHDIDCSILRRKRLIDSGRDQVFRDRNGWHAIVDGRVFGSWELREYAAAGLEVERRRADQRLMRKASEAVGRILTR